MDQEAAGDLPVFLKSEEEYLPDEWRADPVSAGPSPTITNPVPTKSMTSVDFLAIGPDGAAVGVADAERDNPLRLPRSEGEGGEVIEFPILPGSRAKGGLA